MAEEKTGNLEAGNNKPTTEPNAENEKKAEPKKDLSKPTKTSSSKSKSRKKKSIPKISKPLIIGCLAVVVIAAIGIPVATSTITKENTVTTAQLEDAIEISSLSTAEFVYNGIAPKYREGTDEVEYNISYDATCKAGVPMDGVTFDINEETKTIYPHLPELIITSISVDINSVNYLPESPNADIREVLETCENDIESEASQSVEFRRAAIENLQDVIEALTLPILKDSGYTIEWIEG